MPLCYRDRTYCDAPCRTLDCSRNVTDEVRDGADRLNLPLALSPLWKRCPDFRYDFDRAPTHPHHGGKLTEDEFRSSVLPAYS